MKMNFKKTLSLVLAVLMVVAVVPFSSMAAECEHTYTCSTSPIAGKHYKTCTKCYDTTLVDCSTEEEICGQQRVCQFCNAAYGDIVAHVFDQEKADDAFVKTPGDCQTKVVYYKSCKCGALPANLETAATFEGEEGDHAWNDGVSNEDATCTEDGTKSVTCDKCGATDVIADEGSAFGHNFVDGPKDNAHFFQPANCEKGALYFQVCSVCGFNAKDLGEDASRPVFEVGDPVHDFVKPDAPIEGTGKDPATCTTPATFYMVCSQCTVSAKGIDETKFYEDGPLAEHKYVNNAQTKYLVSAANCNEAAIYSMSCSACGIAAVVNDKGEDLTTPGFDPTGDIEVYIDGEYVPAGKKANAFRFGAALNHGKTFVSKEAKEPTCTEDGNTEEVTCEYCKVVLTESQKVNKLGHTYAAQPTQEYKAPTCKQYGQIGKINCETCKKEFAINEKGEIMSIDNISTFQIEPLGHEDKDNDLICDRCDANLEPSDLCTCIACNGTGIMYFIGYIVKWIWKFMGINQYCDCGLAHY